MIMLDQTVRTDSHYTDNWRDHYTSRIDEPYGYNWNVWRI